MAQTANAQVTTADPAPILNKYWAGWPIVGLCRGLFTDWQPRGFIIMADRSSEDAMEDQVKRRAYELWEADGSPIGQDQNYWFKAVSELASAAAKTIKPATKRARRVKKAA